MIQKLTLLCILFCVVLSFRQLAHGKELEYEDDDSHASWGSLRASHAALLKNQRVKRSTVEYYFCLTTSSSQCDSACATQCGNQHALGHTFAQDGKCYAVLDDGSCPGGDNTCSSGFKCSCDIEEITCDK